MKLREKLRSRTTQQRSDRPRPGYAPRGVRATGIAVTSLIAIGTAIVSYEHALDVVRLVGNTGRIAYLIPLFADGLIFLCSTALFAAAQAGLVCLWAWIGLVIGIAVTVTMNVTAGLPGGLGGALIGALTPVVLLISLAVLEWLMRLPSPPRFTVCPHELPCTVDDGAATDFLHKRDCLGDNPTYLDVAGRWGVDRRRMPELVAAMSARVAAPRDAAAGDLDDVLVTAGA
jgi:hypothetical protein